MIRSKVDGFTLAEILVTIGIIAVVAAMTMPALISNHRRKVLAVSLQKAYSTITNGIRLSEIDNGMMSEWPNAAYLDFKTFWDVYINPYFVGAKICEKMKNCGYKERVDSKFQKQWSGAQWRLDSTFGDELIFQLADGIVILYTKNTYGPNGEIWYSNNVYIDVNGAKAPNTYCKDVFPFIRENGKLKPHGCTSDVAENGWEFPKNYPYRI